MPTEVSIVRCPDYDQKTVLSSVRRAADLLGGINAFVNPGERVLLKPNLLKARPPEAAVTTHPEVVRAVIRLVHETGAQAMVGDSPGIGDLRRVCERSGILAVVEQEGAVLADFDEAVTVNDHTCIRCGICQSHCPQKAIADLDNKLVINYRNCIRCFCCQEFCPSGAITVGRGWMLNLTRS